MKQNPLGFWELDPKPTKQELANYYQKQYFDNKNFEKKYSDEEFFHKQISYREAEFIASQRGIQKGKFLDVGCGEGFSLNYFSKSGWDVSGLDYSTDGISRHFPELNAKVETGDTEEIIGKLIKDGKKFDLIILNNVLEHLLAPLEILTACRQLLSPRGMLRVLVPNDFSKFQMHALELGCIDRKFWVAPQDHMFYFERDSLRKSFESCGFTHTEMLGDYPIDFNLMNPDSNYVMSPEKGKNCHHARIRIENMMAKNSIADLVAFRRGCGQAGVGRNIIAYGWL
jgi:2-polyprenyl-3-methyl-5-hydroxy-6-metoxy-1,4-benzoquinol methylase